MVPLADIETLRGETRGPAVVRLRAPRDGVVTAVKAQPGMTVAQGAPLLALTVPHDTSEGDAVAIAEEALLEQSRLLAQEGRDVQAELAAELETRRRARAGQEAEARGLRRRIELQARRVAAAQARFASLGRLREAGYISEAELRAREGEWIAEAQAEAAMRAQLAGLQHQVSAWPAEERLARLRAQDRAATLERARLETLARLADRRAEGQVVVRAPRAGRLSDLRPQVGEAVQAGELLAQVETAEAVLWVTAFAGPRVAARLRPGLAVRVRFDGYPAGRFGPGVGVVESISRAPTPAQDRPPSAGEGAAFLVRVRLRDHGHDASGRPVAPAVGSGVEITIAIDRRSLARRLADQARDAVETRFGRW